MKTILCIALVLSSAAITSEAVAAGKTMSDVLFDGSPVVGASIRLSVPRADFAEVVDTHQP